ncbi:hypothetical protein [Polaromonas hydrogenivorans]|uniref:Uncharacterized protein n=1 Tax=Polaromonas hydrogenivorans TaxID=335476 RepID=A0AAU7LT46_9BURK
MAYAAYCESFGAIAAVSSPPLRAGLDWAVLDVTVPSRDALRVRRALVNCPQAGVLRCIPQLDEQRVRLEIRLPAHLAQDVMQRLMACLPSGEMGPLISWRSHLQRHGLSHEC